MSLAVVAVGVLVAIALNLAFHNRDGVIRLGVAELVLLAFLLANVWLRRRRDRA